MLHIINQSPFRHNALAACARTMPGGDLLLIEDAVYAATAGSAVVPLMQEVLQRFKVYALQPDLEARGVAGSVMEGITLVDYEGFVTLVEQNRTCQSWL